MKTFLIILLILLALGYMFVQWANRPENVAALQQKRKDETFKKLEETKRNIAQDEAIKSKTANMSLVIDEDFVQNKFNNLVSPNPTIFKFKNDKAEYSNLITKGQYAADYFAFSAESFKDFVGEIEFDVSGDIIRCGIVWDAVLAEKGHPTSYQAFYSSPSTYFIETIDRENHLIDGYFSVFTHQKLRIERIGQHVKAILNDKVCFDKNQNNQSQGKVGIYLSHIGGVEYPTSIKVVIKSFKVFRPY